MYAVLCNYGLSPSMLEIQVSLVLKILRTLLSTLLVLYKLFYCTTLFTIEWLMDSEEKQWCQTFSFNFRKWFKSMSAKIKLRAYDSAITGQDTSRWKFSLNAMVLLWKKLKWLALQGWQILPIPSSSMISITLLKGQVHYCHCDRHT